MKTEKMGRFDFMKITSLQNVSKKGLKDFKNLFIYQISYSNPVIGITHNSVSGQLLINEIYV